MTRLTTVVLVVLYPLLLLARALNTLTGADPLRLKQPDAKSLWIARSANPVPASYFSPQSAIEGHGHGGSGGLARRALLVSARIFAPRRTATLTDRPVGYGRQNDIPDEVYTLW